MKKLKKSISIVTIVSFLLASCFVYLPSTSVFADEIPAYKTLQAPTIDGNISEWSSIAKNYLTIHPSTASTVDYFQMTWDNTYIYVALKATDPAKSNAGNDDWARLVFDFDGKATTPGNIGTRTNAGIYAMNLSPWLPGGSSNPVNYGGSASSGSAVLKSLTFNSTYSNGFVYYEAKCEPTDALKAKLVAEGKLGFSIQYDDNFISGVGRDRLYVWEDTDGVFDNDMSTLGEMTFKASTRAFIGEDLGRMSLNGNPTDNKYDWGHNIIESNGTYKMWWTRGDPTDTIWYAESTDRLNWVNVQKVLTASETTWEKRHVADPSVIYKNGTYYMFYESNHTINLPLENDSNIFLATSTNGINWNKYPSNSAPYPVLKAPDNVIGQNYYGVGMPSVIYKDDQFIMYYMYGAEPLAGPSGGNMITRAVSSDGINWGGSSDTHQRMVIGSGADVKFSEALNKYVMIYTLNNQVGKANPPPDSEFNYGVHLVLSDDGITWPSTTIWEMGNDDNNIALGLTRKTRVFPSIIGDGNGILKSRTIYTTASEGTIHTPSQDFKSYASTWDGELYKVTFSPTSSISPFTPAIDSNIGEWSSIPKNYLSILNGATSTTDYFQMTWDQNYIYYALKVADPGMSSAGNNDWLRLVFDFDGKATTPENIVGRTRAGIYAMNLSPWLPGGMYGPVNYGGSASSGYPVLKSFVFSYRYFGGYVYFEAKCEPQDAIKSTMTSIHNIGFSMQYDDNLVSGVGRDKLYLWKDLDGVFDNDMSTLGEFSLKPNPRNITTVTSSTVIINRDTNVISGINPLTTSISLQAQLNPFDRALQIIDKNGLLIENGNVGTGSKVQLLNSINSIDDSLDVIIRGDITGDGIINLADLVSAKQHLLKIALLEGVFKKAGQIYNEDSISISSLLAIKKSALGLVTINQN